MGETMRNVTQDQIFLPFLPPWCDATKQPPAMPLATTRVATHLS